MIWKCSNMAHEKNYFPEKKPVFLEKNKNASWEYSKIISERMKGTTILVWSGDYIVCTVGRHLFMSSLSDCSWRSVKMFFNVS